MTTWLRSACVKALKAAGLYRALQDLRRDARFRRRSAAEMRAWRRAGCPAPPPARFKYDAIREVALNYGLTTLVETGTFYGDSIFYLRNTFLEIHSIELASALYELNRRQLSHLEHIHLYHGDSAEVLPYVASNLKTPTLFWLDGHFCSGPSARACADTPIDQEIKYLLDSPPANHAILIDDARLFVGKNDYPSIEHLRQIVCNRREQASFTVANDIVRIYPV